MKDAVDSQTSFSDPWTTLGEAEPLRDTWLLSFVDILTLFLVLLLVLLMLQNRGQDSELMAANRATPAPATQDEKQPRTRTPTAPAAPVTAPPEMSLLAAQGQAIKEPRLIPHIGPRFMLTGFAETPEQPTLAKTATMPAPETQPKAARQQLQPDHEPLQLKPLPRLNSERLLQELKWKGLSDQLSISQSQHQLRMETKDSVLFTPASAELSPGGQRLLQGLAALLKRHPGAILVEGHADSRPITTGVYPSNWELSAARASSVVRYLIEQGLDAERLRALGYGDTKPKADNATAEGRAANRRVSLVLELAEPPQPVHQLSEASQSPLM